jgi:hypothetical protein
VELQPRPPRNSRVKKKSDTELTPTQDSGLGGGRTQHTDIDPEAAAAVLGTPPAPPPAENAVPSTAGLDIDEGDEENIYEVMKAHMRRQKEELEAKNAAARQHARTAGRPGPGGAAPPKPPEPERVSNLADTAAVWAAARRWLSANARYLESVLGHCCSVETLHPDTGDATLRVPANQRGFTNEKARAKIEEALRAVTGVGVKLALTITDDPAPPPGAAAGTPAAPTQAAQRVPPEIIEAVKQQPVIQQLMKSLDATIVQVELLGAGDAE